MNVFQRFRSLFGITAKVMPVSFRSREAGDEDEEAEHVAGLGRLAHRRVGRCSLPLSSCRASHDTNSSYTHQANGGREACMGGKEKKEQEDLDEFLIAGQGRRTAANVGQGLTLRINASHISKWVILPSSFWYITWHRLTVWDAILTALVEPFYFGFVDSPSLAPYYSTEAIILWVLIVIFSVDIVINFFLAYVDKDQRRMVTDLGKIRWRYLRFLFWVDITALLPWDLLVVSRMGLIGATTGDVGSSMLPSHLAILKWLTLLRLYRVYRAFTYYMEFDERLNYMFITMLRNQLYVTLLLHWSACWWFWLARVNYFSIDPDNPTWISKASTLQEGYTSIFEDYVASLYFVTVSYATVGYG